MPLPGNRICRLSLPGVESLAGHLGPAPLTRRFSESISNNRLCGWEAAGDRVERLTTDAILSFTSRLEDYRAAITVMAKPTLEPVLDGIERELG